MPSTYLPSREGDLDRWLENFAKHIAAAPESYGLSDEDSAAITAAYTSWHTAFVAAINPTTRTAPAVTAKNGAKKIVLRVVRRYAAQIRANPEVPVDLRIGLGLHVGDGMLSPIAPPATYPMLSITEIGRGTQNLHVGDSGSPDRRGKPRGTAGLLLFRAVADGPVRDPSQAAFLALVTRAEFQSQLTHADNGKTATYFARWTNLKGEVGPWSPAASMPIAA